MFSIKSSYVPLNLVENNLNFETNFKNNTKSKLTELFLKTFHQ